jgi:hypothetical protein
MSCHPRTPPQRADAIDDAFEELDYINEPTEAESSEEAAPEAPATETAAEESAAPAKEAELHKRTQKNRRMLQFPPKVTRKLGLKNLQYRRSGPVSGRNDLVHAMVPVWRSAS